MVSKLEHCMVHPERVRLDLLRPLVAYMLLLVAWPLPLLAQPQSTSAGAVHARARAEADTVLSLMNVHLFVPREAVAPNAMIALGVGGVPAPDATMSRSGVVITAAGGFRAPVVVVVEPNEADYSVLALGTPALLNTAGGVRYPCGVDGVRVLCAVPTAGAYVLDVTDEPPASDPLLAAALAALPVAGHERSRPLLFVALIVIAAAAGGGAIAWFLSRPSSDDGRAEP
jgi:hypothetical protein